jgi:hypothetical protein
MSDIHIDYGDLIDDAMHAIVKKVLERVVKEGLPGNHHFFISFLTQYPGADVSEALLEKYPEEMTIVIQHQFDDLTVDEEKFSVVLSFDNVKERIVIPFDALTAFADPSVKFGLQFRPHEDETMDERIQLLEQEEEAKQAKTSTKSSAKKPTKKSDNVVSMDTFRKNNND